jgi:RNA polymerase sigma-70 factor, ECF subfamily
VGWIDAVPAEPERRVRGRAGDDSFLEEFDRVYETAYPRILRTLVAMLSDPAAAEDCTQDAFLKAFRAWPTWQRDAPAEAWVHRIAINTAISYRRRQAVRELGRQALRHVWPAHVDPTERSLGDDLLRELRRLPARQAAAIVLRHLHGYTNREIAAALGVPESTVATRLMTARRTLRARLGDDAAERSDTFGARRVPPVE